MKRNLLIGALITLLGFPLLGWFILQFFVAHAWSVLFRSSLLIGLQVIIGISLGFILGKSAEFLVKRQFLKATLIKYSSLVKSFNLSHGEIIFVSLCAGFGEELLFRGALQPLIGIWPTAILFVAIHGYLNPMNWRLSIYGTYMTVTIALLGYLINHAGIYAAALAHAAIDYVLFIFLSSHRLSTDLPSANSFSLQANDD